VNSKLQPPRVLVGVGFLMLLLTSLQGWGMVAIIAAAGEGQTPLLQELKRLHNLGLTGGFLAVAFGLAMIGLPLDAARAKSIYRVVLPSLLIAPVAFSDRVAILLVGSIPSGLQAFFFGLQAISALGITVGLVLMVVAVLRQESQTSYRSQQPPGG